VHVEELVEQQDVGFAGVEYLRHSRVAEHGKQGLQAGSHLGLQRERVDEVYFLAVKYLNQGKVTTIAVTVIVKLQVDADAGQGSEMGGRVSHLGRRGKIVNSGLHACCKGRKYHGAKALRGVSQFKTLRQIHGY
jgi:hypothetical protein